MYVCLSLTVFSPIPLTHSLNFALFLSYSLSLSLLLSVSLLLCLSLLLSVSLSYSLSPSLSPTLCLSLLLSVSLSHTLCLSLSLLFNSLSYSLSLSLLFNSLSYSLSLSCSVSLSYTLSLLLSVPLSLASSLLPLSVIKSNSQEHQWGRLCLLHSLSTCPHRSSPEGGQLLLWRYLQNITFFNWVRPSYNRAHNYLFFVVQQFNTHVSEGL